MSHFDYKILQVRIRQIPTVALPGDTEEVIAKHAASGWVVETVVPLMCKGLLGGSYTDSVLVFLKRPISD
jgi:hypothetical protein